MEPEMEMKKYFQTTVTLSWAVVAFLLIMPLGIEILRLFDRSFSGLDPEFAGRIKDFVYGLAIVLPLFIKHIRKAIVKREAIKDEKWLLKRLRTAVGLTMLTAAMPAVLGLGLFLLGGLYREFYISVAYSFLVIFLYFPRFAHWQVWAKTGKTLY